MGFKNGVSALLSDALHFITMYMIGEQVDVHVKDGSVYTGIFYTASADQNYSIVLKNAMMTKKGNFEANIEDGTQVDTLVVQGEDLVQLVAKGVSFSESGIFRGDATSGKCNQSSVDKQHANVTRQAGDGLENDDENKNEYQGQEIVDPLQFATSDETTYKGMPVDVPSPGPFPASLRLDDQSFEKHASEKSPYFNAVLDVSTNPTSIVHVSHSISSRHAKDSKLNPKAMVFTPSPYQRVLVIPSIPVEVPNMGYFLVPSLMKTADAIQPEFDVTGYAGHGIQPVSFVSPNHFEAAPCYVLQNSENVTGHEGGGIQPVSFASPYHFESAPAYVHPNSENTMTGQMGLQVYLPPLAHDAITASGGLSQPSLAHMLAHYQLQLSNHQDHFNQPHHTSQY